MKKLVLTISLMLLSTNLAFAGCNYQNMCTKPDCYKISSGVSRFFSKATGSTFVFEKAAQAIIKKELKKQTGANFDVKLKAFSANDLLGGKFKSLTIKGQNITVQGNSISNISIETLCDFNYVDLKSKPMKFKENMVLKYSLEISDADLKKTLQNGGYLDKINKINLSGLGIKLFKIDGSSIDIKEDKIFFNLGASFLGSARPVKMSAALDLNVKNGKISRASIDLPALFTTFDLDDFKYLLNEFATLNFTVNIMENPNTKIQIENINIVNDKLHISGTVLLPKN